MGETESGIPFLRRSLPLRRPRAAVALVSPLGERDLWWISVPVVFCVDLLATDDWDTWLCGVVGVGGKMLYVCMLLGTRVGVWGGFASSVFGLTMVAKGE